MLYPAELRAQLFPHSKLRVLCTPTRKQAPTQCRGPTPSLNQQIGLAETVGFEPTNALRRYFLSREAPSTWLGHVSMYSEEYGR